MSEGPESNVQVCGRHFCNPSDICRNIAVPTGFCCVVLTAVNFRLSKMSPATFFFFESAGPLSVQPRSPAFQGRSLPLNLRFGLVLTVFSFQLFQQNMWAVTEPLEMIYVWEYFCRRQYGGSGVSTVTSQQEEFKFKSLWSLHILWQGGIWCPFNYRSSPPEGNNILFTTKVNKFSWCIFLSCANILSAAWNTHSSSDKHQWQQSAANRYFTLNNAGLKIYINRKQKVIAFMERLQTVCLNTCWCLRIDLPSLSYSCPFSPSVISHCPCSHFLWLEWLTVVS